MIAQDPYRFCIGPHVWVYRDAGRIDVLDSFLEECIRAEKYELCIRIREIQRQLLQRIWRENNPVRPETGLSRIMCIISGIKCNLPDREAECDFTDDPGTIFRSLEMKKRREFVRPLVLKPQSPDIPILVRSSFPFPVEMIRITRHTGRIEGMGRIVPSTTGGTFIQSFTGHSAVILAPAGFIRKQGLDPMVSMIEFREIIPY